MAAPPPSKKDGFQVLQYAFDDATGSLRTNATIVADDVTLKIDHTVDSIRLGDGTNYLTSTTVGGDVGLDVNIIGGELAVEISAADGDNIAISDGTDTLNVNADGSLTVQVDSINPGNIVNSFNEVTSVPSSTLTLIETYTAPGAAYLQRVSVSGTNIATYDVFVNSNVIDKKRTYFGAALNADFEFTAYPLTGGDIVTVKVTHNRPNVGDFNARIQVLEV